MSLFISSDDEQEEPPLKRIKIEEESDPELSESEWEDVLVMDDDQEKPPLPPQPQPQQPSEFSIVIEDQENKERKQKIKQLIKEKRQRVSLHYLSMVSYIIHARSRNHLLSSKKVQKTLKKMIPDQVKKVFKKFKKNEDKKAADEQLIYIIKYLIKWFRKNFKHDSNGLRVLGYSTNPKKFPNNAREINNETDLISVIKKFQHNRDTGAQIFTALLRSLGFESRLVFSLPLLPTKVTTPQPKLNHDILKVNKDNDLLYPYYWTELINPLNPSEIIVLETQCFYEEEKRLIRVKRYNGSLHQSFVDQFYPVHSQLCQMSMHYVLSFSNDNLVLDVSSRYMKDISYRWFNRLDLRTELGRTALLLQSLLRIFNRSRTYSDFDNKELDSLRNLAMINYTIPNTFSAMKNSPNFITPSTLRYNEVIIPGTTPVKKIKLNDTKEPVYFKNSLLVGKSEQQWKFLGRSIKLNEIPIKFTKATPRTLYNKRVYNQNELENPDMNKVKLYSFEQTCPYIKLKVTMDTNGRLVLPKNKYGNVEIFRDNMIPDDCVWLKLTNIESILKNKAHYVPVVTGFSFKSGQAFPVKEGVIVLKRDELNIKKLWLTERMKEYKLYVARRNLKLLYTWKFFLKNLQIKKRIDGYL
ncbi:DNA repair RAD34-like protein, putative [Candida maltosa Xu316]|uniref:DNA repair RAD34-like protein, putative n=1 Tax=Candida maltosa (strain Xu316) TaxID=1245528 RepID=M3K129_CANMX|nr:DNA repair RAD34-like protein, putative [Candida maltosa Xu316]